MINEKAKNRYQELFDTDEKKAKAFDLIAEKYYYANFGTTPKSDFDVLMFSIYIEEILKRNQHDFSAYSDYTLSKQLGITQSKVSNLKVRKELIYPYEGFSWEDSFLVICDRAVYEDGNIKLFVPDKNLYIEIKNAIENAGGYVEAQLTTNLLQVRLPYFLDLLIAISEKATREELRTKIKKKIEEDTKDIAVIEREPIGKVLLQRTPDLIIDLVGDCIPLFSGTVKDVAKSLLEVVRQSINNKWEK